MSETGTAMSSAMRFRTVLRSGKLDRISVLLDQGFTSVGNFALTLALVRAHSSQEFGAFGMAMFTLIMISSFYRYAFVVPVSLWNSARFHRRIKSLATHHLATQFALGGIFLAIDAVAWLAGAK